VPIEQDVRAAIRSSDAAEHDPDYRELASFATRREALDYAKGVAAELG
jgi:hypothetical protein